MIRRTSKDVNTRKTTEGESVIKSMREREHILFVSFIQVILS